MLLYAVVPLHPSGTEQIWEHSEGRQQTKSVVEEPLYMDKQARALQSAKERTEAGHGRWFIIVIAMERMSRISRSLPLPLTDPRHIQWSWQYPGENEYWAMCTFGVYLSILLQGCPGFGISHPDKTGLQQLLVVFHHHVNRPASQPLSWDVCLTVYFLFRSLFVTWASHLGRRNQ